MRHLILALAVIALPVAAQAQDSNTRVPIPLGSKRPPPIGPTPPSLVVEPVAMLIATFDADAYGNVTREEMRNGLKHTFDLIDTAHTGKLGYIQFADWAERWMGDRTALPSPFEVDADGDGQITLDELQAAFSRIFDRLDKNKDGKLSRAELLTVRGDIGRVWDDRKQKAAPK